MMSLQTTLLQTTLFQTTLFQTTLLQTRLKKLQCSQLPFLQRGTECCENTEPGAGPFIIQLGEVGQTEYQILLFRYRDHNICYSFHQYTHLLIYHCKKIKFLYYCTKTQAQDEVVLASFDHPLPPTKDLLLYCVDFNCVTTHYFV